MYKREKNSWLKHMDFMLLDIVSMFVAIFFAYLIYFHSFNLFKYKTYRNITILMLFIDLITMIMFNTMHNVLKRGLFQEFAKTVKHVLVVYGFLTITLFAYKFSSIYSRVTISLSALLFLLISYLIRLIWKKYVLRRILSSNKTNMILICSSADVKRFVERSSDINLGDVSGVVLTDRNGEGEMIYDLPVVANLDNAGEYICREWVDEVFFFPETMGELEAENEFTNKVSRLLNQCRQMAIPIHIRIPLGRLGAKSFVEKVNGFNVVTYTSNYISPFQYILKRLLDIIGGFFGSIAALFVILIVGFKIKKESPGPILFTQERIGRNGKKFKIYKLRSMYLDAEERKKELMDQNRVSDGMMFKMEWDPRIIGNKIVDGKQTTGIGEFIRSTSLDEFPQFFNVLKGNMSLVGTRPPTVDEWEKYKYHHRARLAIKPGITGMWQVSGRSEITDFEEVVRLDTEYIESWSLGLDIKILLKTVKVVFKKDGAM